MFNVRDICILAVYFAALLCCPVIAPAAEGAPTRFVPARFSTGPESLLANLRCPTDSGPDRVIPIFCQANISAGGNVKPEYTVCYPNSPVNSALADYSLAQLRISRFEAASIDGQFVSVYMGFRIMYSNSEGDCRVTAIPNLGFSHKEYGANYVAPQQILDRSTWLKRAGFRMGKANLSRQLVGFSTRRIISKTGPLFRVSANVSTSGTATDPVVETRYSGFPFHLKQEIDQLEKTNFIPGFVLGRPVQIRYHEVLYIADGMMVELLP